MSKINRIIRKLIVYGILLNIILAAILFLLINFKFFTGDFIGRESGPEAITVTPDSLGLTSATVRFPSRDGLTIEGWLLPADPPGKAVIILAHGGGSNRSRMLGRAAELIRGGFDVLAIDLRAHGGSEGNLNTLGMLEALDVLGAVDFLEKRGEKRPIVLMGLSLGSVSSINAAVEFPGAAAVIAEGSFKTYRDAIEVTAEFYLKDPDISFMERLRNTIVDWPCVDFLSRIEIWYHAGVFIDPEKTNAIESVRKIKSTPILFLTGENDFMEPENHAQVMVKLANNPLSEVRIIKGGGHSAFNENTKQAYCETVFAFLDKVLENVF